jgi:hypothetical protein
MSERQDFTIFAGRDYELPVTITEDDGVTPIDLTGCSLAWVVSRAPGQAALVTKTTASVLEIDITSDVDGEATIFLGQTDTEDYGGLTCEHEMVLTDVATDESTVMHGLITIQKSLIA